MRIVIFDMDGTLVDTGEDIAISVNHVRAVNHGLPPVPTERIVEWINLPVRNLPQLFYETPAYEDRDRKLFESHYHRQCIQNVRAYDGIEATLAALCERHVKLAVATNAPSTFARRILAHVGLADYFTMIEGPDTAGASKPDPAMLVKILSQTGFRHGKHRGWMVGDNAKDLEAARAAGINAVFCTWGFGDCISEKTYIERPEILLDIIQY